MSDAGLAHGGAVVPEEGYEESFGVATGVPESVPRGDAPNPIELLPTLDPNEGRGGLLYGADVAAPLRDSARRRALALADVIALVCAYFVLWILAPPPNSLQDDVLLLAVLPIWVGLNKALRLYDRDANVIHKSTLNEFPAIVQSISTGSALVFLFGPLLPQVTVHRTQIIVFWISAIVLTTAARWMARTAVRLRTSPERLLIVGSGEVSGMIARKVAAHGEYGARIVGYVDAPTDGGRALLPIGFGVECVGDVEDFEVICRRHDVERVVIAFSTLDHSRLLGLISASKRLHLKISVVPRLFEVIGHGVEIDQVEGMTLLGLRGLTRTKSTLALKRSMDLVGATAIILLTAPLLAAIAIAIKLTSPGPVLFAQRRVGRANRDFKIYKFRTMVQGADALKPALAHLNEMDDGPMFKISDDPRITPVGGLLRRASLDELPQLWNVLRGEMSLVGPRPLIPPESDQVIGWHRARLDLTPGLTGPWQVMGRNAIPFQEMVKLDYLYVAEWSLWNDVKLLVRTLPVVVGRNGH
jgi:exopolysaccharide biosynthesis polyprenyl glycosylphosphotransferase